MKEIIIHTPTTGPLKNYFGVNRLHVGALKKALCVLPAQSYKVQHWGMADIHITICNPDNLPSFPEQFLRALHNQGFLAQDVECSASTPQKQKHFDMKKKFIFS